VSSNHLQHYWVAKRSFLYKRHVSKTAHHVLNDDIDSSTHAHIHSSQSIICDVSSLLVSHIHSSQSVICDVSSLLASHIHSSQGLKDASFQPLHIKTGSAVSLSDGVKKVTSKNGYKYKDQSVICPVPRSTDRHQNWRGVSCGGCDHVCRAPCLSFQGFAVCQRLKISLVHSQSTSALQQLRTNMLHCGYVICFYWTKDSKNFSENSSPVRRSSCPGLHVYDVMYHSAYSQMPLMRAAITHYQEISQFYLHTPHSSVGRMNQSWSSFTEPEGMEG